MIEIQQIFDPEEIKMLSYGPDLCCISEARERGLMNRIKMCQVTPEAINNLIADPDNMFVIFKKGEKNENL